jgi:hypothetical protein
MTPCFGNRKQLALLAIGGLNSGRENTLRAHLEACPGCRAYLAEISRVAVKLRAIEPTSEIRASHDFHRKTLAVIEAGEKKSEGQLFRLELSHLLNWRLALPAAAILAISLAVLPPNKQRPVASVVLPPLPRSGPPANRQAEFEPTVGRYELVANESLDKLDELITLQAKRSAPSAPVITASLFPRSEISD